MVIRGAHSKKVETVKGLFLKFPCAPADQAFGENFDIINYKLMT